MQIALALNSVISNQYKVIKVLGKGGFGIVYLCQDLKLNIQVVLKECFPDPEVSDLKLIRQGSEIFARNQSDLELFYDSYKKSAINEAKRISAIRHPNIVQIKDSVLTNGTVYIVMDFVEGKSLDKIIKERQFSDKFVINILTSLLETLDVLHDKNIFHKDLKPENIIVRKDNSPVIIDFGSARSASELKRNKTMIYSDFYSAPELTDENMEVDGRCDIFSLGVIMHELITGKKPSLMIKNNGGLKGSVYEKTYNKNFLESIDVARSFIDADRFSSARAWLDYLKKVNETERIINYESETKTKDESEYPKIEYPDQSQGNFGLDTEFSLKEDNSAKLIIGTILLVIACMIVFNLDWEMHKRLKGVFFIIMVGIAPLWRTSLGKAKEVLSLYLAQANDEFAFDLHLNAEPLLFGRAKNADIQVPSVDKYMCVSREHFTIYYRESKIIINNLKGEENPMLINGHRVVGEVSISTGVGSILQIGNLTFRLKAR